MNIFGGMKVLRIFFFCVCHHKIGLYLVVISCILRSRYRMGVFLGLLNIHIFFGVLEIPDIFCR